MINFDIKDALIAAGILCAVLTLIWHKTRRLSYLLFFSIFFLYMFAALQAVIFPFVINPPIGNAIFRPSINLIPFNFGNCSAMPSGCLRDALDNFLLTMPFGFGINFLVKVRVRFVFWLAAGIGIGFEMIQLGIALIFRSGFRAIDINDSLLNAGGVLVGFTLFIAFGWIYRMSSKRLKFLNKGLAGDILEVVTR